jgi:hypothetical protein
MGSSIPSRSPRITGPAGSIRPGVPPGERTTLVGELDGLVAGVIDVRIAYPGGSHRRLRHGYVPEHADAGRFYRDRMGYRPAGEIVLKEL